MSDLEQWWKELGNEIKQTIEYKVEDIALRIAIDAYKQLKKLGFTQRALAKKMGVSEAYISQVFGGKNNMTIETLVKLADALQMDIDIRLEPNLEQTDNIDNRTEPSAGQNWNDKDNLMPSNPLIYLSKTENISKQIKYPTEQEYASTETDSYNDYNLSA